MMYQNIVTGAVVYSKTKIKAEGWVLLAPQPSIDVNETTPKKVKKGGKKK